MIPFGNGDETKMSLKVKFRKDFILKLDVVFTVVCLPGLPVPATTFFLYMAVWRGSREALQGRRFWACARGPKGVATWISFFCDSFWPIRQARLAGCLLTAGYGPESQLVAELLKNVISSLTQAESFSVIYVCVCVISHIFDELQNSRKIWGFV